MSMQRYPAYEQMYAGKDSPPADETVCERPESILGIFISDAASRLGLAKHH
jgi:hypothetical protein